MLAVQDSPLLRSCSSTHVFGNASVLRKPPGASRSAVQRSTKAEVKTKTPLKKSGGVCEQGTIRQRNEDRLDLQVFSKSAWTVLTFCLLSMSASRSFARRWRTMRNPVNRLLMLASSMGTVGVVDCCEITLTSLPGRCYNDRMTCRRHCNINLAQRQLLGLSHGQLVRWTYS